MLNVLAGWFVLLAPVPLALKLVTAAAGPQNEGARRDERSLALLLLYPFLQILVGLVLGLAGWLATTPLLVAEAILLAAGLGWRGRGFGQWRLARPASPVEAAVLATLGAVGLIALMRCVLEPTWNFDSLAYHLPVMARWVSSGGLEIFDGLGQIGLYPSHHELFATVLVLPWHDDLVVPLPNLLAWLQAGLAIRLLARRLGATADGAALGAGFFLFLPAVISRVDAIQPDLALAAVFVTVLAFVLRQGDPAPDTLPPDGLDRLVAGAGLALLPGLKLSGPVLLLILVGVVALGARHRGASVRRDLRRYLPQSRLGWIGFGLALVMAGLWYVRNLIALGNPFGEIELRLFGQTVFAGSLSSAELQRGSLQHVFRPGSPADWRILAGVAREWLGPGGALLIVGAALAGARGRVARPGRNRLLVAGLFVVLAGLYWTTPYSADNGSHDWRLTPWMEVGLRYAYAPLALLAALAARGLGRWPRVAVVLAGVLAASGAWTSVNQFFIPLALRLTCVALAAVAAFLGLRPVASRWTVRGLGLGVLVAAIALSPLAGDHRTASRKANFGHVVAVLDAEVGVDEVIAAVNTQQLHLGSGRDWRRRVILPELPAGAGADLEQWLRGLRRRGVTTLLLGHNPPDQKSRAAVEGIQKIVREPGRNFTVLLDYESQTNDLAVIRLYPGGAR